MGILIVLAGLFGVAYFGYRLGYRRGYHDGYQDGTGRDAY